MTNNLTDGMIRLLEEISALRHSRAVLTYDLALGRIKLGHTVAEMIAGFQRDREEMGEKTKVEVAECVSGVKEAVAGLRAEFASDINGARQAWSGSTAEQAPIRGKVQKRSHQAHSKAKRKKRVGSEKTSKATP